MNSTPLIICAQQRSGTTVLQKTLNESPYIQDFGEVFHDLRSNDNDSYFSFKRKKIQENGVLAIPSPENQTLLFDHYLEFLATYSKKEFFLIDVKYNSWHHFDCFWHAPLQMPFALELAKGRKIRILHLIRKNVFRQFLSSEVAIQRAKWHYPVGETVDTLENKIHINPMQCKNIMELSVKHTALFSKWLKPYPYSKQLYYEDAFKNGQFTDLAISTINDLMEQDLNISKTPKLQKIISNAKEMVSNKEEIISFFRGSEYQDFVESTLQ